MRLRGCALTLLGLLLAACAQAPRRPASAPTVVPPAPADVAAIPNPVPREEPRSASGNPPFYEIAGHRYIVLASAAGYHARGVASWQSVSASIMSSDMRDRAKALPNQRCPTLSGVSGIVVRRKHSMLAKCAAVARTA